MIVYHVDNSDVVEHMERATEATTVIYPRKVFDRTFELAEGYAPEDTRELIDSFYMDTEISSGDDAEAALWASAEHAKWLQEGSGVYGPHGQPIQPVTANALKFRWPKMGNQMTVWKGDLYGAMEKAEFSAWARTLDMVPFVVWPKGMEANNFEERTTRHVDTEAGEIMDRTLSETGVS